MLTSLAESKQAAMLHRSDVVTVYFCWSICSLYSINLITQKKAISRKREKWWAVMY